MRSIWKKSKEMASWESGTWRYTRGPDIWVAHEIMHSLDPTGMGWDGNGRLSDIWDTPTASR